MNRKSSIPLGVNRRKSGSLGFRQFLSGGGSQEEMPSVSRPRPSTSMGTSMQNMSVRQSLMPNDFPPSSSRNSRYGYTGNNRRKRSSSQEPPRLDKRRTFLASPNSDQHHPTAGLLVTPCRPTPSKSPFGSLASINRMSASSRRHSSKLHIISNDSQKMKDPRVISDKNFKNNAFIRIHNFLQPSGVKIKPLSNASFIQAFNAMYKELDPNTQVTKSDYAEKITNLTKNLGYPGQMSKTSFIAVNSGHAVAQVVALLSWLVEGIDFLGNINIEESLFRLGNGPSTSLAEMAFTKTCFDLFTEAKAVGEVCLTQERVEESFMNYLGDSADEQEVLENEIKSLTEEIQKLEDDPKKAEDIEKVNQITESEERINIIRTDIESYMSQSSVLKAKINSEKEGIKTIEMDNSRFMDMCAELSDRIERQPMKHTDRDKIIEHCKQLSLELKSQREHLEMVHRYIHASDIKVTKLQNDIRTVIHDINGIVLEHQLSEQYKWSHKPTHADAQAQLERATSMWELAIDNMEKSIELSELAAAKVAKDIEEIREEVSQKEEDLRNVLAECAKLDSKINDEQGFGRMKEQEMKEAFETVRNHCLELTKELQSMPRLEELQSMITNLNEEHQKTKTDFQARKKFLENYFFPNLIKLQRDKLSNDVEQVFQILQQKGKSLGEFSFY